MEDLSELHTPVMLDRCVTLLAPACSQANSVVVDGTIGMGGHSEALLERFDDLTVIGLDRDTQALAIAQQRLARFGARIKLVHTVYDRVKEAVRDAGYDHIDGMLLDLGVSSLQLDSAERGFAYAQDAPLDMRMNQQEGTTAAQILAESPEGRLREIFERYGDEPLAGRYARAIVRARAQRPIVSSGELVEILQDATPAAMKHKRHPAKRVFQALRIEVNDELGALERVLPAALGLLRVGGRLVVMSYQSLEDRLVKRTFRDVTSSSAPPGLPVELDEHLPRFKVLTRGAETASEDEQRTNPRSIPVRLRAVERVR